MEAVGMFVMEQLLKMQWLSDLISAALASVGVDLSTQWGGSLHFFVYDTAKIVLRDDIRYQLCSKLFPARAQQAASWSIQGSVGQRHGRSPGDRDAVLQLLVNTLVHRLYPCRTTFGRDIQLPYILADG